MVFPEERNATFAQSASIHLAASENPQGYVLLSGKNSFSIVVPLNNFLLNINAQRVGFARSYVPINHPLLQYTPREMVAVMDCTFFGRARGYLVVRDPHRKENVYWSEIERETSEEYQCARDTLESLGFVKLAVVADGKPGLRPLIRNCPYRCATFIRRLLLQDT